VTFRRIRHPSIGSTSRSLLNKGPWGRGALSRFAALLSQTLGSTRRSPRHVERGIGCSGPQDPPRVLLGDGPGGAGVGQPHRDESAEVQGCDSVV
jgi:hypothetical protein